VIAWTSYAQDGSYSGIYAQRYNSAGIAQGGEFRVNTYTTSDQSSPAIAMDAGGDFAVAWQSRSQDDSGFGVYAQRYAVISNPATVGGVIWQDTNVNGVRDAGEAGVADVIVGAYLPDGAQAASVITSPSGTYTLGVRPDSEFYLEFTLPSGFIFTLQDQGGDDTRDSDVDRLTGRSAVISVPLAGPNGAIDAGVALAASVTGAVYFDRNGDAARDTAEEGLPGFRVFIDLNNNGLLGPDEPTSDTSPDGTFLLSGVLSGSYSLRAVQQAYWASAVVAVAVPYGAAVTGQLLTARTGVADTVGTARGDEFRVNTYTTNIQSKPTIALDADGDFVVAWQSGYQDGYSDRSSVYAQRFSSAGVAQGGEFRVNTYTTSGQSNPTIAMDEDGDFVIVWHSSDQDGDHYGIYAQRYNSAGIPQGSEFRVNTYTPNAQSFPTVAMDADGDFVIAWQSYGQEGSDYGGSAVYAQRYNSAGVAQGGEFRVNTYTTSHQFVPAIGIDTDGDFVIAWQSFQDGNTFGIYAQRYNAAGVAQGGEFRVNTYTPGFQSSPTIALDADGDFVIGWASSEQDGIGDGVYAQRYNSVGVPQGGEFRVNTFTTGYQSTPAIGIDADGDLMIAWQSSGQEGSYYDTGIYAQRYNSAGVLQGGEIRVNSYANSDQSFSTIAMDADGDVVIAWQSNGQDGSGYGVYAQRYGIDPNAPPLMLSSTFNVDLAPQQISFAFSENVSRSLWAGDLVLTNLASGTTIPASSIALDYNATTFTARFTFPGLPGGILPDGNYRAVLPAEEVADDLNLSLAVNATLDFYVLGGDANRDHKVDVADLAILSSNWQQSPRTFSLGDFDYNGTVDVNDLGILASHWQQQLAAPPLAASRRMPGRGPHIIDDLNV
jgi:hypothetical protein